MRLVRYLVGVLVAAALSAAPCGAARTFHTFIVSEVYSSVDGSVQFIELRENLNFAGQHLFAGHTLTASNATFTIDNVFTFPSNLPSSATAGRSVLIATANFASLPGGITPDYVLQAPTPLPFVFPGPGGGGINFAGLFGGADVTYASLPTDGINSLHFPGGAAGPNTPRNFAGQTGSISVPSGACCVGAACSIRSSIGCAGAGGTFTQGATCGPSQCGSAPMGACCTGTACGLNTQAGCTGGSIYQGDGTACGPVGNPTTCCRANFNMIGGVTVQDIFDYLAAYFLNDPSADFNGVGGVTVQDIFDYLAAYFVGCG